MKMSMFVKSVAFGIVVAGSASAQDWSGFYAGVSASSATSTYSGSALGAEEFSGSDTSPGVFVGYNHMMNNKMVVGGELSYSGVNANVNIGGTPLNAQGLAQLRARLGFANGNIMPYVAAGVSRAKFEVPSAPISSNETGYNVGFGLEYMFSNNMSARVEYGVTRFDNVFEPLTAPDEANNTHKAITVGMAFHF